MMKRFAFALIVVALTLALLPGAALAHDCGQPADYPLYAGQDMPVGHVYVCNDEDSLTVTYDTTSGWSISETHLWIGDDWQDAPQKNGNPIPGQFPYKGEHDPAVTTVSYDIPRGFLGDPDPDDTLYIAAQAVVWNNDWYETAWGAQDAVGGTNPFPGNNWATYIEYSWQGSDS